MKRRMGFVVEVERPRVAHLAHQWAIKVIVPYTKTIDGEKRTFKAKKLVFAEQAPILHTWIPIGVL